MSLTWRPYMTVVGVKVGYGCWVWVSNEPNTKKGGDEVNISKTTGCLFRYVGLGCWLAG